MRAVLILLVPCALFGCGGSGSSPTGAADMGGSSGSGGNDLSLPGTGGVGASDLAMTGNGGGSAGGGGTSTPTMTTVNIAVPASFSGTTRQLLVAAFDSFPVTGPPSGVIYMADNPVLTAGQTVTFTGDASKLSGAKYVLAVLYMTGGGVFSPTAGIDYESADEPVTFTGQPVDLGTLTLALAK